MILGILLYVKEEEEYGGKLGLELGFDFKNKFYDWLQFWKSYKLTPKSLFFWLTKIAVWIFQITTVFPLNDSLIHLVICDVIDRLHMDAKIQPMC